MHDSGPWESVALSAFMGALLELVDFHLKTGTMNSSVTFEIERTRAVRRQPDAGDSEGAGGQASMAPREGLPEELAGMPADHSTEPGAAAL